MAKHGNFMNFMLNQTYVCHSTCLTNKRMFLIRTENIRKCEIYKCDVTLWNLQNSIMLLLYIDDSFGNDFEFNSPFTSKIKQQLRQFNRIESKRTIEIKLNKLFSTKWKC